MVEKVRAERFDGEAAGGVTIPLKMQCLEPSQRMIDVFVKCSWVQCPPGGLARDLIGCLLAECVGLAVGRPVLVEIPPELIEMVRQISPSSSVRIARSVVPAFGSVFVGPGFSICRPPLAPSDLLTEAAAEIWAFDQLLMNPDRTFNKPNCLINQEKLIVIDHEKALSVQGVGSFVPPPWDDRWTPATNHLFQDIVQNRALSFERLQYKWSSLTADRVSEVVNQVPLSWNSDGSVDEIASYLSMLIPNLNRAIENLGKAYK